MLTVSEFNRLKEQLLLLMIDTHLAGQTLEDGEFYFKTDDGEEEFLVEYCYVEDSPASGPALHFTLPECLTMVDIEGFWIDEAYLTYYGTLHAVDESGGVFITHPKWWVRGTVAAVRQLLNYTNITDISNEAVLLDRFLSSPFLIVIKNTRNDYIETDEAILASDIRHWNATMADRANERYLSIEQDE